MSLFYIPFLAALFGAVVQEVVHWYNLRAKLELSKYKKLLSSRSYWVVTSLMILVSALGPVLWKLENITSYSAADFMILGAAFPLIFKKAVAGISAAGESRKLGDEDNVGVLKEYFS